MSSEHIIIVARNITTDELQLPLGNTTLYGTGEEESVLETCRLQYDDQWVLSLYRCSGQGRIGKAVSAKSAHLPK